jgi:cytochrome c-type biogenesis protein CcmH
VTRRVALIVSLALALSTPLALPALAADQPNQADLEGEIVCPTCKTTLDQSNSPIATRMKAFIRERLAAGDSAAQIKAQLVDQFGPNVLAEPPKHGFDLLAWVLPLGGLAVGAVVVGALAWSWSRRRETAERASDSPGSGAREAARRRARPFRGIGAICA